MKFHDQRVLADPARGDGHNADGVPGDCWKACVASLLGIEDYDSVPHFVTFDDWWGETRRYVWEQTGTSLLKWRDLSLIPAGINLLIGVGPSPGGEFYHAVLVDCSGQLIHDPHPARRGVLWLEEFFACSVPPRDTTGE